MDGLLNKLASLGLYQTLFSALTVIQISFQIIQDGWGFKKESESKRKLGDFLLLPLVFE